MCQLSFKLKRFLGKSISIKELLSISNLALVTVPSITVEFLGEVTHRNITKAKKYQTSFKGFKNLTKLDKKYN